MNPSQQHLWNQSKKPGQNLRNRLQANVNQSDNEIQNQSQSNQNNTSVQGKISLRNNNTKKLYKQNTEGEDSETLSILKDSKQLQVKIKELEGRGKQLQQVRSKQLKQVRSQQLKQVKSKQLYEMKSKQLEQVRSQQLQGGRSKNKYEQTRRNEQQRNGHKHKTQTYLMENISSRNQENVRYSQTANYNQTEYKVGRNNSTYADHNVSQTISSIVNGSSILSNFEGNIKKKSSEFNPNNNEGNHGLANNPSIVNRLEKKSSKRSKEESSKSINMTGEDLSGFEVSNHNNSQNNKSHNSYSQQSHNNSQMESGSMLFYQSNNYVKGYRNNNSNKSSSGNNNNTSNNNNRYYQSNNANQNNLHQQYQLYQQQQYYNNTNQYQLPGNNNSNSNSHNNNHSNWHNNNNNNDGASVTSNNSKQSYSNTQPSSMLTSVRQEYLNNQPMIYSVGSNNNNNSNVRSNLSTTNSNITTNTINTMQTNLNPNTTSNSTRTNTTNNNNNNNHTTSNNNNTTSSNTTNNQFYFSPGNLQQLNNNQGPARKTPSYHVGKVVYQKQSNEREPSINKSQIPQLANFNNQNHNNNIHYSSTNNTFNHFPSSANYITNNPSKIQSAKELPNSSLLSVNTYKQAFISHRPYEQPNAKSSLTVRTLQFGIPIGLHSEERTKSHTKNYSTSELLLYNNNQQSNSNSNTQSSNGNNQNSNGNQCNAGDKLSGINSNGNRKESSISAYNSNSNNVNINRKQHIISNYSSANSTKQQYNPTTNPYQFNTAHKKFNNTHNSTTTNQQTQHNTTQQLTSISHSQPLSQFPSSLSSPNNRNSFNPYQHTNPPSINIQNIPHNNNPISKPQNIPTNMNKSSQNKPSYFLDSIQQKDEFNKIFVRANNNSNSKNQQKSQSAQSIKHLQRQKLPQPNNNKLNNNTKHHKIQIINNNHHDSSIVKSFDPNYSSLEPPSNNTRNNNQNYNALPSFVNLKYIKSPTNNTQEKLQLLQKTNKNYQKYLKVGYQPLVSGSQTINQLISQQRQKHSETHQNTQTTAPRQDHQNKQDHQSKQDNQSVNSSFKDHSKSQTHSIYSYNSKAMTEKSYQQSVNQQQPTMKGKNQRGYPIQIYSSNKNFHQFFNSQENTQQDGFRKTIDPSMKPPHQKLSREEGKPLQSLGPHQPRPQFHFQYDPSEHQSTRANHTGMRFKSPDYTIETNEPKKLSLQLQNLNSPDYSPPKQTVFSPTQKSLQPAQKSYFLSELESQQSRDNARQKKSIKKMLVSQSKGPYQKSEVFYNYNFKDLLKGQKQQNRPNSKTILEAITKNQLTKIFCSTFKIGENENGCDCIPKCPWVENWIQKIHKHPNLGKESMMKNLDKNSNALNFSSDNIWKNFNNEQVISFPDMDYSNMKLSKEEMETFKQIEKDIPRTCSSHPTFRSERYREFLRQILIHFYYLDPQLGYVQGMNIIAAGIAYHSKTVLEALQIMDYIMNVLNYRKIYMNDMKKCKQLSAKTTTLIKHYCYDMYNYVTIEHEVDLQMFILGWYFSMLGTFVPLESLHLVINKFIENQFDGLARIIVTYFIFLKDILMEKTDPNEIMEELSLQSMVDRSQKIDWNQLITVSDKLQITLEKDKL